MDFLLPQQDAIRLGAFLVVLAIMALWELAAPQRRSDIPRVIRWSNNLSLVAIDPLVLRLVLPVLAVGAAFWAQGAGWGLLPLVGAPDWLAIISR